LSRFILFLFSYTYITFLARTQYISLYSALTDVIKLPY